MILCASRRIPQIYSFCIPEQTNEAGVSFCHVRVKTAISHVFFCLQLISLNQYMMKITQLLMNIYLFFHCRDDKK